MLLEMVSKYVFSKVSSPFFFIFLDFFSIFFELIYSNIYSFPKSFPLRFFCLPLYLKKKEKRGGEKENRTKTTQHPQQNRKNIPNQKKLG